MDNTSRVTTALRECHLKVTKHRVNVLKILIRAQKPLSADAIYHLLMTDRQSIDLSTIYRILETLAEKELVIKVTFENEVKNLYEYNHQIHHHFLICLSCNQITKVESCPLGDYEELVSEKMKFRVIGHKLEFYGYCEDCQKKQKYS